MINRDRFPLDPWRLVEAQYSTDDLGAAETIFAVGNGYLGIRGSSEVGGRASEHGTFVNGFHEVYPIQHAEQAFGFAEVGQTIINAPDAKVMRVYVDDEPLALETADLRDYERALDFRTGQLTMSLLWILPSGKEVRVETRRMVSFDERHLALASVRVTVLNADAAVTISCQVINRQDRDSEYGVAQAENGFDPRKADQFSERVLQPSESWHDGLRTALSYKVTNSGMTLGVIADHRIETENHYDARTVVEPDLAKSVFRVRASAGVPTQVTKYFSYHTGDDVAPRELLNSGRRTVDRALALGEEKILERQARWCEAYWKRSDVEIEGQDELQQATRWCLFQIAQASARADELGIPAKGVSGSGYGGHYFWDTECYVVPFLAYTSPQWARNALRMRYLMLPAARRRAKQMHEAGALFPWRTINGEEASAYYAAGTAQYHINADVTFALGKYVRAADDTDFLHREGADIAVETARLWATLGFWRFGTNGQAETFHIHGVTGPDEYTTVVNDNLYTNVMARNNLRYAVSTVRHMAEHASADYDRLCTRLGLHPAEIEAWEAAADAMHIPYSDDLGIHPQDAVFLEKEVWDVANTPDDQHPLLLHFHPLVIYRYQVLKQPDVVLALFLQGNHFSAEEKLADFEYYDPLTTGDSTLSSVVQTVLAAEVGYSDLALEYFKQAAFVDLANLHSNTSDGVHVASAAGVWTGLVSGFGGMRDHAGHLSFDPRLPADWSGIRFALQWQGVQLHVTIKQDSITIEAETDKRVDFSVRGEHHWLTGGSVTVPLDDSAPRIPGRPTLRKYANERREDGSRLSASIPDAEIRRGAHPGIEDLT